MLSLMQFDGRKLIISSAVIVAIVIIGIFFFYGLAPASAGKNAMPVVFGVTQGEKFRTVIGDLRAQGLIRSSFAADTLSIIDGAAFRFQPGLYKVNPSASAWGILGQLTATPQEITVTIPEGSNIYEIDAILSNALVIRQGSLISFAASSSESEGNLEGRLFPDTYQFFPGTPVQDVIQKLLDNFNAKAGPLLAAAPAATLMNATSDIIVASIVEKEVSGATDQKIVAGIIWKRLKAGIPLDVDASICYIKFQANPTSTAGCLPLTTGDYQVDSAYNTYLYKGLPPGPIGNPGITAIQAAIAPEATSYWYYLTDPATGKTIYAETLDEQDANRVRYLKAN